MNLIKIKLLLIWFFCTLAHSIAKENDLDLKMVFQISRHGNSGPYNNFSSPDFDNLLPSGVV